MDKFRTEKDSMGEIDVPSNALYGAHTQRSLNNFKISQLRFHPEFIKAILAIKRACALANKELGFLDANLASCIVKTVDSLRERLPDAFPLDVFEAGSGTSLNMNVNEVVAHAARIGSAGSNNRSIHPNDHVNKGQSTNDVIPSSIRVASVLLLPALDHALHDLVNQLGRKSREYRSTLKAGRTHLQDAVPMTSGQEFTAWANALGRHRARIVVNKKELCYLSIGGNAIGTGLNTPAGFRSRIVHFLSKDLGHSFKAAPDAIELTQFMTDLSSLGATLRLICLDLTKICNDLRLLSSGPNTGLAELILPAVEPGSSIMPGKINPSIVEAVNMASYYVQGNMHAVDLCVQAGQLELNTHMPLLAYNLIESIMVLTNALHHLSQKCVKGIIVNEERVAYYVEHSAALATALNPVLGYDTVAALVKESLAKNKTVRELVLEKKLLGEYEISRYLDPQKLTKPNR